jgi:predicted esterase
VIEVGFGRAARDLLVAAGIDVTYRESAVVHTIDPANLPFAAEWLAATVPPQWVAGAP